jgi:hypothetical protein
MNFDLGRREMVDTATDLGRREMVDTATDINKYFSNV